MFLHDTLAYLPYGSQLFVFIHISFVERFSVEFQYCFCWGVGGGGGLTASSKGDTEGTFRGIGQRGFCFNTCLETEVAYRLKFKICLEIRLPTD